MKLMIVESPNKTRRIEAELGGGWKVVASVGHVRDIVRHNHYSNGIPSLEDIGLDGNDFSLDYDFVPPPNREGKAFPGGKERVARIKAASQGAATIYLATDPDREGEAIAWHLKDVLDLDAHAYSRVTFNEISGSAIRNALIKPREIDMDLVHAQEARRAVDRMVGYLVSPVLSNRLGIKVSAGRVQSVAARLVVDRERLIQGAPKGQHLGAEVFFDGGRWQAEWITDPFVTTDAPYVTDHVVARHAAECRSFKVIEAKTETTREAPPRPFSTALLLRTAAVVLGLDPEVTAKLAQRLFEHGTITYVRTDSVNFGSDALDEIRAFMKTTGTPLSLEPRRFENKARAQEAHEAIRPTNIGIEEAGTTDEERALYRLIRTRTIASQLTDARYQTITLLLGSTNGDLLFKFKATERVMIERGWRVLLRTQAIAEHAEVDEKGCSNIPMLDVGAEQLADNGSVITKHIESPKRYTKASLIEKMESEEIGRPATYPVILATILAHDYVKEDGPFLVPTQLGELVVDTLVKADFSFVDLAFTRRLEQQLDAIADGNASYLEVLKPAYENLLSELTRFESSKSEHRPVCPHCGRELEQRIQDNGVAHWHCRNEGCKYSIDDEQEQLQQQVVHPCPKCGAILRHYKRKAGKGYVWACPADACKTFFDDDDGKPLIAKSVPCPRCGRPMYRRRNKDATGYWWGCSGYRDGCDQTMDDKDGQPIPHQPHDKTVRRGLEIRRKTSIRGLDVRRGASGKR